MLVVVNEFSCQLLGNDVPAAGSLREMKVTEGGEGITSGLFGRRGRRPSRVLRGDDNLPKDAPLGPISCVQNFTFKPMAVGMGCGEL